MDGLAVAELKGIVAPLNFTEPMTEKAYSYNYEPPPGVPVRNTREETHQVKILDGRALNTAADLERAPGTRMLMTAQPVGQDRGR